MSFKSRLLRDNGSPPLPPGSSFITSSHPLLTPIATFLYTCSSCQQTAPGHTAHHSWQHNVISVIDGDIPTMFAILESVPDVMMREGMWQITVQLIPHVSWKLEASMLNPTQRTTTSIPLWITNERLRNVEPGAHQIYKGGNVTIFFLSHVFFLIFVIHCPYFHFTPQYEEVNHYLLTFDPLSSPLLLLL